jgi:hypothetical protein
MVAWNTQLFIFGWCENFLVGISCVYILFFNGRMESEIGEANSHLIIFGWCEYIPHGYFILHSII